MKQLVIFVLFILSAGMLFAQNTEAVIKEMSGTVELKKSGAADWAAAKEGERIAKDTIISTGFKSSAILTVGNSTITARPLTRLSLAELLNQSETETISIGLSTGRVQVEVNPPAGGKASFTVQSPMATASVRGTSFEMNTAHIQVLKGAVHYHAASGTVSNRLVIVTAGQESWIETKTDSAVHPAAASEITRNLPVLPGQNARPYADNGVRLESDGTLTMGVTFVKDDEM